ncbi:MAG: transposase [Paenibacillus sp.]|nr:transposase [Paenibacillus sp.]
MVEEALAGGNFSHAARKHDLNPETVRVWVRDFRASGQEVAAPPQESSDPAPEEDYEVKYNRAMRLLGEKEVELRELLKKKNPAYLKK